MHADGEMEKNTPWKLTFCSWNLPSLILDAMSSMRFRSTMYGKVSSMPKLSRAIQTKSPTDK